MSSNQKNVLLGVLVLIIVGMSVYLSQARNPQSGTSDSAETASGSDHEQSTSGSEESTAEISLEQSDDTTEQAITTDKNGANTSQTEQDQRREEDEDTQQELNETSSNNPDPDPASTTDEVSAEDDQKVGRDSNTYVVQEGDNLRKIADQFYGNIEEWKRILDANSEQLTETGSVEPGMTLTIPPERDDTDASEASEASADSSEESADDSEDSDTSSANTDDRSGNNEQDVVEDDTDGSDDRADTGSDTSTDVTYEGEPPFEAAPDQRWYRVQDGDSLWEISVKVYGTGKHFSKIWELNKDRIRGYDDLHPGDWLLLPENP